MGGGGGGDDGMVSCEASGRSASMRGAREGATRDTQTSTCGGGAGGSILSDTAAAESECTWTGNGSVDARSPEVREHEDVDATNTARARALQKVMAERYEPGAGSARRHGKTHGS
jgi:hypothetical protein